MKRHLIASLAFLATAGTVAAQQSGDPRRFDGNWQVALACDASADGARSYRYAFFAGVSGGHLHGEYGAPGTFGSLILDGQIAPDGTGRLNGSGLTGNPGYSRSRVQGGTPYRYVFAATFQPSSGHAQMTAPRSCTLDFTRQ